MMSDNRQSGSDLSSSVARVVAIDALWQKPFAPALPPSGERGAAAFCAHARAKAVLAFARAFGWLVGSFHKAEQSLRRELGAVTLGMGRGLSIQGWHRCRS